jgi:hypothetical protein
MAKFFLTLVLTAALMVPATLSFACGIAGSATRGGSDVDGTVKVSTSWNSSTAYPRKGTYSLDLGNSACGENIEVFVNGYSIGKYRLPSSGNAKVNFQMKGTTDYPIR